MVAVDLAVLFFAGRTRSIPDWCLGIACAGIVAVALAVGLGEDNFGVVRLAAYGVFLHGTVLAAGSAIVLWRTGRMPAVGSAAVAVALPAVAAYAFLIEPAWLEVSYLRITSPKIDRPLRIVVLADLQTDRLGRYEREVFRRVLQEEPDVILLAGDYLQAPWPQIEELGRRLNAFLHEIEFPGGAEAFAVRGNVDGNGWPRIFDGLDVTPVESSRSFDLDRLRLTCLGLVDSYRTSLTIAGDEPGRFHLVLGHAPDFALGRIQADLLVAGHTHGGQVRLPLIGPLTTHSRIPRQWAAGLTDLPDGGRLIVSRGIGMERHYAPRLRFLCRPELVVIDLAPQADMDMMEPN